MIPRTCAKYLIEASRRFPALFLTGPRQSGKTTLARASFPDYAYANLENLDDRAAAEEDPRRFLGQYAGQGVIIDEAHKVPAIFSYLQQILDESGRMGGYLLTGSQNFLLAESVTQSLAGRGAEVNLLPFSRLELPEPQRPATPDAFIFQGMYPALYDRHIPPAMFYPNYLQTYIERDVRSLKNIGNLNLFRRFLQLCAGRVGQLLNLSSLGAELGIDAKTVRSWLSVLEASFIVFLLPPHFRNYNKRIVKHPKLYFYDTGLACALLGLTDVGQLSAMYLRGALFENAVIAECLKARLHAGLLPNLSFWRDNTGNEIDLILDFGSRLAAVEIKSGSTVNQDFFQGLKRFRAYAGLGVEDCFLVHGGNSRMQRSEALVLPWDAVNGKGWPGQPG